MFSESFTGAFLGGIAFWVMLFIMGFIYNMIGTLVKWLTVKNEHLDLFLASLAEKNKDSES